MKNILKIKNIILTIIVVTVSSLSMNGQTVTDYDGNIYNTVKIGSQVWMKENLHVTHYRNGDRISYIEKNNEWNNLTSAAYCYYESSTYLAGVYGYLYNWYAVNDSRHIAPVGWHVATKEDWEKLINYLGGNEVAGAKLKEYGSVHWTNLNYESTNESGFTALGGGLRSIKSVLNNGYNLLTHNAYFWSSGSKDEDEAWSFLLMTSYKDAGKAWSINKKTGCSIRCVKD